jgi:hypothetical protein
MRCTQPRAPRRTALRWRGRRRRATVRRGCRRPRDARTGPATRLRTGGAPRLPARLICRAQTAGTDNVPQRSDTSRCCSTLLPQSSAQTLWQSRKDPGQGKALSQWFVMCRGFPLPPLALPGRTRAPARLIAPAHERHAAGSGMGGSNCRNVWILLTYTGQFRLRYKKSMR